MFGHMEFLIGLSYVLSASFEEKHAGSSPCSMITYAFTAYYFSLAIRPMYTGSF